MKLQWDIRDEVKYAAMATHILILKEISKNRKFLLRPECLSFY